MPAARSVVLLMIFTIATVVVRADETLPLVGRYVAIDNVCAWPNLKVLDDGTIVATIFGKPSHGRMEGDVECWASSDGLFWNKRSVAAAHDPNANRMNVAVGFDRDGNLLVLASGWSLKPDDHGALTPGEVLPSWSCRSADARTWSVYKQAMPAPPAGTNNYIPFGDLFVADDGSLRVSCYARTASKDTGAAKNTHRSWVFRSDDGGDTWRQGAVIGPVHNETTLLHLGGERWLAAARREYVELFRSDDDCRTWSSLGPVTERNEINAHLQRLRDGRLLLTFGRRIKGEQGIGVRFSSDEGRNWSKSMTLIDDLLTSDSGYPSSIERADGAIVTAYYASAVAAHQRYHMGVAIWMPPPPK
ncbi:MAG TPA: sialidase family protein [Pirellulales bacterium]|jgi:hypothetical protein|nr:sialidase family protein [Pirellulales bacterium]